MRAPTLGTQNPVAQGIAGVNAGSGFASTAKNVGNELLGAVRGAASEAASQAVQQVGGTATSVIKQGLTKAGGYLGNLISAGLTSVAKKVIGDAPAGFENFSGAKGGFIPPISPAEVYGTPLGFGTLGGRVPTLEGLVSNVNAQKVVGDAPPGGQDEVMTQDQQAAAVTNLQNSVTFNMMSRLILNEQVMVTSTSLPRGMNEAQLNNFYARDLESLVGTYRQSEVQTTFGLKGMTLQYTGYPTADYDKATDKYEVGVNSFNSFWCTGVALETSRVAPPCTANTTLNQLAPLLAGAALGEYSSQLRVKTFSTDLDLMVRASAIAMNNIQSQQGYSFCLPLVKAMGYLLQQVQLFGSEINDLYADAYFRPTGFTYTKGARRFPLEALTDADHIWNGESWKTAAFAVISESDFVKAAVGIVQVANWNSFAPQFWGTDCAIVFIPGNDKSNEQLNSVRMAAQAAYPMNMMYMKGRWHYFNRDDVYTEIPVDVNACKKASLTRIPGPTRIFLFVVMGAREAGSAGIRIGDGTGQAGHFKELNAIDNPPHEPYVIEEDGAVDMGYAAAFANSYASLTAWVTYIKEWETTFGNSSDRSSAMRFWADHSVIFANYFLATNGLDVGSAMTMSFLSWANPARTNIGTPEAPVWKPSALEAVTDIPQSWTTSGRWCHGATFLAAMASTKTATYLPVADINTPLESGNPWRWEHSAPDFSRLPFEDPMMNYLVYKKWITPNEEYPEVTLDDPARLGHTITVMANLMAGLSDLTSQQRDFLYTELMFSPLILTTVPMAMMRAKNVLWPAFEEILTNGIQFPQYWNNRDCNVHCYNTHAFWQAAAPLVVPEVVVYGSVIVGSARIPVNIMGQWFSPLYPQYIQLRLNLPVMKPQRNYITVNNVKRAMLQAEYSEEGTGLVGKLLSPISWLMWRLSLGVIVGPPPINNGWLVQATNNQGVYEYYVHMEQPDASRDQVLVREYGSGNVTIPPTSFVSLPVGEFILKRALTTALQPFNVLMQGPLDAFIGVGSGSTAYQMFVQTNTPQAIFVSDTWATIPDWLFSPTGLQSGRDTI